MIFPTTKLPEYGYESWQEENVTRNSSRSAKIQEKDLWGRTRFHAKMRFNLRTDDSLVVYGFWKQNRLAAFDFFDYDDDIYYDILLGTTSGVINQEFDIPARTVRAWEYKVGVGAYGSANAVILPAAGAKGQDRLKITNTPAADQAVYMNYTGRGLFTCKFSGRPQKSSQNYKRTALEVSVIEDI